VPKKDEIGIFGIGQPLPQERENEELGKRGGAGMGTTGRKKRRSGGLRKHGLSGKKAITMTLKRGKKKNKKQEKKRKQKK